MKFFNSNCTFQLQVTRHSYNLVHGSATTNQFARYLHCSVTSDQFETIFTWLCYKVYHPCSTKQCMLYNREERQVISYCGHALRVGFDVSICNKGLSLACFHVLSSEWLDQGSLSGEFVCISWWKQGKTHSCCCKQRSCGEFYKKHLWSKSICITGPVSWRVLHQDLKTYSNPCTGNYILHNVMLNWPLTPCLTDARNWNYLPLYTWFFSSRNINKHAF